MFKTRILPFIITALSTVFIVWNVHDESYLFESRMDALFAIVFWLAIPFAMAAYGMLSSKPEGIRVSICLSAIYMLIFMGYALNGSTAERFDEGAQHAHLYLVPIILAILTPILAILIILIDRFRLWVRAKTQCAPIP